MTVSSSNNRLSYNGDGSTVAFTTPYFLSNSDIKVYVGGSLKTYPTDYTLSGAGVSTGGTATLTSAPPVGTGNVVILRDADQLQGTKLPPNDPFPSAAVEVALDKLTMLVQRCRDLLSRSFTLPDSDTSGVSATVPSPAANMALKWNSAGTGLTNSTYDPDTVAASAAASASAAATSASNAGASASSASSSASSASASAAAAAASAASLPNASGNANTVPVVNGTGTGWLMKTAAQMLAFLGLGVANQASGVVVLDASSKLPAVDGSQLTGIATSVAKAVIAGLLPTAISGTNTTAAVTISSGQATDSTGAAALSTAGNTSWAVSNGNAINGYQGGTTLPNSSTIHFFICSGASGTGTFASTSLTPTLPAGYNISFRRIFSLTTNGVGALIAGTPVEIYGGAIRFYLATQVLDVNAVNIGTSKSLLTLSVPTGIKVAPLIRTSQNNTGGSIIYTSGDETDVAPATVNSLGWTAAPGYDQTRNSTSFSMGLIRNQFTTNTSAQIGARADTANTAIYLVTSGYDDFRRV